MTNQRNPFNNNQGSPFNTIIGIVAMVLGLLFLLFLARFIFRILWYLSPLLLIGALIVDYKGVINFGKWIIALYKRDTILGVVSTILTIFGFPLVAGFLLGKGLFKKRAREIQNEQTRRREGEFVDFEELDSKPLELPELEKRKENRKDS
jgi:hypothetical protein